MSLWIPREGLRHQITMIKLEAFLKVSGYISRLTFRCITLETHFSSIKKQISVTSSSQSIFRQPLSTQRDRTFIKKTKGKLFLILFKQCNRQRLAIKHFCNIPQRRHNRHQLIFRKSTQRDNMWTSIHSRWGRAKMCNLLMRVVKRPHSASGLPPPA
jgi:hypothetical protein